MDDQPTTLWTLGRDGREASCRVRLVPYGIEVDLLRDGATLVTRTFDTGEEALAWAERKRADRMARGWHDVRP
ncbi:MAG: hypothetical protein ACM3SQ_08230 [Betaproteobacteria bacterium]